jgi:cell division protease FtsH
MPTLRLSLVEKGNNPFLGQGPSLQRRSEKFEELIDSETREIIDACYKDAKQVLSSHRHELEQMARLLLRDEKIDGQEIQEILGPRVSSEATAEEGKTQLAVVQP